VRVQAHLAEVYAADVSRQTISTITDQVLEGMAEWQNRPLDAVVTPTTSVTPIV
jgi:transposase-like protein